MRRSGGFAIVRRATNPRSPPVPAQILDGRQIAQQMREKLRAARSQLGPQPIRLVSIEIGQNPAAAVYVRNQQRAAAEVGLEMEVRNMCFTPRKTVTVEKRRYRTGSPGKCSTTWRRSTTAQRLQFL
jgi:hypothetical protein